MMDDLDSIRPIFFEECAEQLTELERALAALESGAADDDTVNAAFRAVHSIKGGAGSFGMTDLVRFAHAFETALDLLRSHRIDIIPSVLQIFLRATDVLSDLTAAEQGGPPVEEARQAECKAALESLSAGEPAQETPQAGEQSESGVAEDGLPEDFVPVVVDLFDFDDDVCVDTPEPVHDAGFEIFDEYPADPDNVSLEPTPPPALSSPEIASVEKAAVAPQPSSVSMSHRPASPPAASIRVDVGRIDRLIDLVGELVIGQAALCEAFTKAEIGDVHDRESEALADAMSGIEQLTRDIQDAVMAVRAQPLRTVFQRMQRVVRETSLIAGKTVHLVTEGEDTEVDRTLIERLTDPLTHMLRNAIDHGIETAEKRVERGKSPDGTILLSAAHKSGRVVISITDDGGGINRERVHRIAVEKGIVPADAHLTENEIDNLIFAPGFSTSETVTDLSGRGVGMDVVKQAIQDLGGRITIRSETGKGSSFVLALPLTLAVMDGMVVVAGGQILILPVSCIVETLLLDLGNIFPAAGDVPLMSVRGKFVPVVDIANVLGFPDCGAALSERVVLVVEDDQGRNTALVADGIEGQMQIVIKNIEKNYRPVQGVSAATILGNGHVALILDVPVIAASTAMQDDIPWLREKLATDALQATELTHGHA